MSTEKTAKKAVTDIKESIAIEKHLDQTKKINHRGQQENSFKTRNSPGSQKLKK